MLYLRRSVLPRLRLLLLAVSALLVLGLNHRPISVLRAPAGPARLAPRTTVVKQKVLLEAVAALAPFVAPAATAWEPGTAAPGWGRARRRRLAAPRLRAGIGAGAVFRARLLGAAVSPQAP